MDEAAQQVKRIVAENRAMNPEDILMDMTLEDELGITGDDATDLFQDFAQKFPDVDLNNLDLSLYFGPEGCAPWVAWCPRRPLRVSDLVQAARDKRWRAE
jgi:acyl carrier protein